MWDVTALYVELVVIGFEVLVWLFLLLATIAGMDRLLSLYGKLAGFELVGHLSRP